MKYSIKNSITASCIIAWSIMVVSCANMASPTGGAYDFDAPKLVRTSPKPNATQVKSNKVTFEFDENVVLVEQSEKVIITPPQQILPLIRSANKKVTVTLNDSLQENTTYTIDFTDAITDNNEGNVFDNFSFSFSTGDVVDSLSVSGTVLAAEDLEPVKGMFVGLHSNLSDTAFTKTKFLRISRTNDYGKFTIRGVAPGEYHIFALDDKDRDYMYGNPSEGLAFLDTIIVPTVTRDVRNDTITILHKDFSVDSISTVEFNRFLPDNIVLRSFQPNFAREYLTKYERDGNQLKLFFGAPPTEMPKIRPLSFDSTLNDWALLERTVHNDSLSFWIKDMDIAQIDTLAFELSYLKTDTLNKLAPSIDTLNFIDRNKEKVRREKEKKEKERKKKKKKSEEPETEFLGLKVDVSSTWDIYKPITFEFEEPIVSNLSEFVKFEHKQDTTFVAIPFNLEIDSLNPRKYVLKHRWDYENEYRLSIDSASVHGLYGLFNNKYEMKFKIRKRDEYGMLAFSVSGIASDMPAFIEILDKSDKPKRKAIVKDNMAVFRNINPDIYYARIVLDKNGNGKWDTGDYYTKQQAEVVSYYDKSVEIKANWEIEQSWVVDTINLVNQKPLEVTKNKPKDKESRQKQMENRDNKEKNKKRNADEERRRQTADPTQLNTSTRRRN